MICLAFFIVISDARSSYTILSTYITFMPRGRSEKKENAKVS